VSAPSRLSVVTSAMRNGAAAPQVVMAMLARSAPAMNLFSVGMPATILAGVILMAIAAPALGDGIAASIQRGLDLAHAIVAAGGR